MPERIQLRRTKGWRMPPATVAVARPHLFGNHYVIGGPDIPDASAAVARYREWIMADHFGARLMRAEIRKRLRGKNLACWCPRDQPCHADVLLEIANA